MQRPSGRQEAQKFNHEYIGTEHILLGLILEGSGVAANVLRNGQRLRMGGSVFVRRLLAIYGASSTSRATYPSRTGRSYLIP